MDEFINLWDVDNKIGFVEVIIRSAAMFLILLFLIRIGGMRPFGKGGVIDTIIVILLGSVVARGIVGASPFLQTIVAAFVLILVHKLLSIITFYNKDMGRKIKGKPSLLYDGQFNEVNMRISNITHNDIMEELRLKMHLDSLEVIDKIYMERTGEISFILKQKVT
ncbi:MAG TPA: YetF domain-containing protein [Flavisolibacter sp.]|nr:YetF domain-containing protein [Flavisolibacter sp.]